MIRIKRAYEPPAAEDGERFLVDCLWPRGRTRDALALAGWAKDAAPSDRLRKWFGHDPKKWEGFLTRYFAELDARPEAWRPLLAAARKGTITLTFGAKDTERNNAADLKIYLDKKRKRGGTSRPKRKP